MIQVVPIVISGPTYLHEGLLDGLFIWGDSSLCWPETAGSGRHSGSHFEEKLFWNAGRDYGREMMGRLMLNWKLVRPANSTWNFHVFQHREKKRLCSCGWVV